MNRSNTITFALNSMILLMAFSFTPVALCQEKDSPHADWGLKQALLVDRFKTDQHGTMPMNCIIEFAFESPPTLNLREAKANKYLEFNAPLGKARLPTKIVFVTPESKAAWARVPAFKVIEKEWKEPYNLFVGKQFKDYPGDYYFEFGLDASATAVKYIGWFHDGAEHHIYGEVRLFGLKFSNESKDALVFKITNGKYLYVSGTGKAITQEGRTIEFGK
jgi:hypothetical protein